MKKASRKFVCQFAAGILLCAGLFAQTTAAPVAAPPAPVAASPSPALSSLSYDHVSLSVQDLDREVEWYTRVLGFKETKRMQRPNMVNVNMRNANMRIDLIQYTGSTRTPANPVYLLQGWAHLALTVPDIPAALAALKAQNADVKGGGMSLTLRDPEGNEMEIFAENSEPVRK